MANDTRRVGPSLAARSRAHASGAGPARVDIRRVASDAGVSIATVSRVTSGKGPVKDATRERVLQVVRRLQYSPSASARSLRTARTMLVGVLVPDLGNPVFTPFLRGVQHAAQAEGYSVLVVDSQRSVEIERRALDRLLELRVDALVLGGAARDPAGISRLRHVGMVVVDVHDESDGRSLIPELEAPGTIAMCDVLAMLGHRRIGYLTGAAGLGQAGRRRLTTLRRRCDELGMGVEHLSMRRGARPDDAAGVLREAVASNHGITALCSSLGLAPTVLNGLRAAGFRLPDDCSFATYGDSDWAAAYRPAISVVTMDLYEVATLMTRQTLALLGGDQAVSRPAPEPARFLRRESVGPSPNVGPSQSAS